MDAVDGDELKINYTAWRKVKGEGQSKAKYDFVDVTVTKKQVRTHARGGGSLCTDFNY